MKKIITLFTTLCVALCSCISVPVYANECTDYNDNAFGIKEKLIKVADEYVSSNLTADEFMKLYDGDVVIEQIPLSDEQIKSSMTCTIDGDVDTNSEYHASLEKITVDNNDDICAYYLISETRTTTSTKTKDDITFTGSIVWIDNLGINNELISIYGSRSGNYTGNGSYSYGAGSSLLGVGSFAGSSFSNSPTGNIGLYFYLSITTYKSGSTSAIQFTMNTI